MNVMEIIAPRGSIRLEDFPTFEEYIQHSYIPFINQPIRRPMTEDEKRDYYSKKRKKFIRQQCKIIKAFMKQHRSKRRNGHKGKA